MKIKKLRKTPMLIDTILVFIVIVSLYCFGALIVDAKTEVSRVEELRRLLHVVDNIDSLGTEVMVGSRRFKAEFVKNAALGFIVMRYNGETAEEFIHKWCYRTPSGKPILIVTKEGQKYFAQDLLLNTLYSLDEVRRVIP